MAKLLLKEESEWKGVINDLELYESNSFEGLNPVKQCQAVCFLDKDNVVLYKHKDEWYGLPGGTVEEGESFEETLKREVFEESSCKILDFGLIGYIRYTRRDTNESAYQLRYWAKVEKTDVPISDPDKKSVDIEVINVDKAPGILGWGKRGEIIIDLAKKAYKE